MSKVKGKALLFGLNYKGTDAELHGCIHDVNLMSDMLKKELKIKTEVYTDDVSPLQTTSMGMLCKLYELAVDTHVEKLDLVWIHYSGHGSYIQDINADEQDGNDECLVPSDYVQGNFITDDQLQKVFSRFNPATRIICVFDCCHSGTMCDVKYMWETDKKVSIENINCAVPSKMITLSGCMDTQTSADAYDVLGDAKNVGALTSCLLLVFQEDPTTKSDVFKMLTQLRKKLKDKGFSQIPKLCSTYNLVRDRFFVPLI